MLPTCIQLISSVFQIAFIITVITYKEPDYGDGYIYKPYAIAVGFLISIIPMLPIPIMMLRELTKQEGPLLKVRSEANEPRHEKTCFCHMRTTKAQISLRIRAV